MCDIITPTVMMYISIASTAVSLYAQNESAKAQSAQIENQADNEREEIGDAAEEELGQRIKIKCFTHDPSINSSLKFLRKTPWAREKAEALYLKSCG